MKLIAEEQACDWWPKNFKDRWVLSSLLGYLFLNLIDFENFDEELILGRLYSVFPCFSVSSKYGAMADEWFSFWPDCK